MVIHSNILAWRIRQTEESGGIRAIGSQRIRHDFNNLTCEFVSRSSACHSSASPSSEHKIIACLH